MVIIYKSLYISQSTFKRLRMDGAFQACPIAPERPSARWDLSDTAYRFAVIVHRPVFCGVGVVSGWPMGECSAIIGTDNFQSDHRAILAWEK